MSGQGRFHQTVSRTARRLRRHTTALGLLVAAVGLALAYIAWISVNGVPFQNRYELHAIVPSDSPILKEGDAVRIAGRLAGLITGVEPYEKNVKIDMELEPGFAPVGEDARTNVRVKSIVYLTYLDIYPGDIDNPMPEGGTIPLSRSGSGVDLLEVVQLFDRRAREALSKATYNVGLGVAGRGEELNSSLADVPPLAKSGAPELEALTRTPGSISRTLEGLEHVSSGLRGQQPDDVAATVESGSAAVGAVASESRALARSIELLRPVEDALLKPAPLLRELLGEIGRLTVRLRPAVENLAAAAPDLNRVLAQGDELRRKTARLTSAIDPVLIALRPALRGLYPVVASIQPILDALKQITGTIGPYAQDIHDSSKGLISATSTLYPEGATAPGSAALRFAPILTCHRPREPYPEPGETRRHSQPC